MSRELTFWNDETIARIREHFVAASVPTWLARAKTPEGELLRVAGIQDRWVTSSGYMSCITADGDYLGDRPTKDVLEKFRALPEDKRRPDAKTIAALEP
ncbi:MAG TPA: hypothetical protein VK116_01005, partial [Planctomycetota bacterium]|nr:hypothetical protein [Planctomycetota bacterium]